MTETTSKVEKWSYPLKVGSAEATDPQKFYKALAKAKDGYYPLGANGLWHGGVHFDEDTGLVNDLTEVRCIADGEVVAYRIDEKYPTSDFGSTHSVYSTGFVLVKHRLEFPVPPASAPAAGPSLTFFSLYMHLLDWENYKTNPTLKPPGFWGKGLYEVKANAPDKPLGIRMRSGNAGHFPVLAVLPRGTTVVTQPAPANQNWVAVVSVSPEIAGLPANGWVFKGQLKDLGGGKYFVGNEAQDPIPGGAQHGANVRDAHTSGLPLSHLPAGTRIRLGEDPTPNNFRKLAEIVSGQATPALIPGADGKLPGFIWSQSLTPQSEPHSPMGDVVVLTPTYKIKAGEVLGHVGKYQNHSDAVPKNLLHLEVFSCEDVKAFTDQSKPKGVSLPAAEKTLVKIPKGSRLITHSQSMSATNPPKAADPSSEVAYDFFIPVGLLEGLPAEKKIKESVVMNGTTTTTYWWRLDGLLGDEHGDGIDGWFAEPDTTLSRHSPFEWEGFTFIDETVSNADHFAAFLHAQESLNEQEREAYLPSVETAASGSVTETLYKILDRNGDKKLAPSEIAEALNKPWFSQPISQMVTRYENEWNYKKEKWDALDEIIGHSDSDPHKSWVEEKSRIERLSWWLKLIGLHGITADAMVQHIHPVGLISNFVTVGSNKCKKCGKNVALSHDFMKRISAPSVTDAFIEEFVNTANAFFSKYEVNSCSQIIHLLGQGKHETGKFKKFRESLRYSRQSYTPTSLYNMAPTVINAGFARLGLNLTQAEKIQYVDDHLIDNDPGYGRHSFGVNQYPQNDYRGRGLLHLTHYTNYHACAQAIGVSIDANPELVESNTKVIIESGLWFWKTNNIGPIADNGSLSMDQKIRAVTKVINPAFKGLAERDSFTKDIANIFEELYGACPV
ncbi:glycoside hydrolase family 19 protein [Pseudomonas mandelii]|uniref:glycoside hydrolase family 19 protein n=1 Tax=Pseudomonas mandelii TaxID=75612 RepID=UPI0020A1AD0B|nr:glycoside hydrolase family 19 protein [Pseudomonas mandelii]MCO8309939.1 hypothetical protein [Pseudomonas mandelii]